MKHRLALLLLALALFNGPANAADLTQSLTAEQLESGQPRNLPGALL